MSDHRQARKMQAVSGGCLLPAHRPLELDASSVSLTHDGELDLR